MLSVYGESLQKLKKKFARRTALFTWLWCTAILNAIEDKSGYDRVSRPWFLTQGECVFVYLVKFDLNFCTICCLLKIQVVLLEPFFVSLRTLNAVQFFVSVLLFPLGQI